MHWSDFSSDHILAGVSLVETLQWGAEWEYEVLGFWTDLQAGMGMDVTTCLVDAIFFGRLRTKLGRDVLRVLFIYVVVNWTIKRFHYFRLGTE